MKVLTSEMVTLGAHAIDKVDAIRQAGEILVRSGCVLPAYVEGMQRRERVMSTYLGSGIAIPHGETADLQSVHHTGVSVLQLPEGVEWEPGERVSLVIGLASTGTQYVEVLSHLVDLLQQPKLVAELARVSDPAVIVERLSYG